MSTRPTVQRGRTRAIALAAAVAMMACAPEPLRLPDVSGAASVAVVLERAPRVASLADYAPAITSLPLVTRDDDDAISVRFFAEPLAALGLPAGTVDEAASDPWARRLPAPERAFLGPLAELAPVAIDELEPFAIPMESPLACAARGGCFVDESAATCTVPCPAPVAPTPPAPPERPRYLPCPAGWSEDTDAAACRPFEQPPAPCPSGQLRQPGEAACHAPITACPAEWADGLDDATTTFVRTGGSGGDGTRAAPLGTIAEALARDTPTIALSRGAHGAPARLEGARALVGACPEATQLRATGALSLSGGVALVSLSIEASALHVEGAARLTRAVRRGPVTIGAGGSLTAASAVLESSVPLSVGAGATLRLEESRVVSDAVGVAAVDTASVTMIGSAIEGVDAAITATAATISLHASRLSSRDAIAVRVRGGALTADAVEIRTAHRFRSVVATGPARAQLRRLVATGESGGLLAEVGSDLTVTDARFDDTVDAPMMVDASDARVEVRRVTLGKLFTQVVRVQGQRSSVTISDVDVPLGTLGSFDLFAGDGISIERCVLASTSSLKASEPRGATTPWQITVDDVLIHRGVLRLANPSRVRIRRLEVREAEGSGVVLRASPQAPSVTMEDLRVFRSRPQRACGTDSTCAGSGVYLEAGDIDLTRFAIEDSGGPAITVQQLSAPSRIGPGVVTLAPVALAVGDSVARTVARRLLEGVVLREVATVCSPCGR